ncbi:MAG: glycosyltransferase [Terriglobia bacterium]
MSTQNHSAGGSWRIVCYHGVPASCAAAFEAQLRWFKEQYTLCSLADGVRRIKANNLTSRLLTLTFDDGDETVATVALPAMQRQGIVSCLYVVPDFIDQGRNYRTSPAQSSLSWPQLREWLAAGNEVGNHTFTHVPLPQCSPGRLRQEVFDSRARLEDELAVQVGHFSYPWGQYTPEIRALLADSGAYDSAATIDRGSMGADQDPLLLHRDLLDPHLHVNNVRRVLWLADHFYALRQLRPRTKAYWEVHRNEDWEAIPLGGEPLKLKAPYPPRAVSVFVIGARARYGLAAGLLKAGLLQEFYTDFYLGSGSTRTVLSAISSLVSWGILRRATERHHPDLDGRVHTFPAFGVAYALAKTAAAARGKLLGRVYEWADQAFGRRVARTGIPNADAVIGLNGASLEVFREARRRHVRCILLQVSAAMSAEEDLCRQEAERWRGWQRGGTVGWYTAALKEREQQEWALADAIAVPSEFAKMTLSECGAQASRCLVLPDAYLPRGRFLPGVRRGDTSGPLRVLYVGRVSLMKGVPYFLEAMRRLGGSATATIVGEMMLDTSVLRRFAPANCQFFPNVPHSEVWRLYWESDVFAFPSLSEGSAAVTYEALSTGLPVITTFNSGSVVRDGVEGYVVPIRDSEAIAESIALLERHRDVLAAMRERAVARAKEFTDARRASVLKDLVNLAMDAQRVL